MSFFKPLALAVCAIVISALSVTATQAQLRPRAAAQSSNLELTQSCEQLCRRNADQRACISACYSDRYRRQQVSAASKAEAIRDINDWAAEEDVKSNPYLTAAAKNAILGQRANDFDDFRIPNDTSKAIGPAVAFDDAPLVELIPLRLAQVYYHNAGKTLHRNCESYVCELSELYDMPVEWITLNYRLTSMPAEEARMYLDAENLRKFRLEINDVPLTKGQSVINGDDYLVAVLDDPCEIDGVDTAGDEGCMIIAVNPDKMFPYVPPYPVWHVALHFEMTEVQIGPSNPVVPRLPRTQPNRRPPLERRNNLFKTSAVAPGDTQPGQTQSDRIIALPNLPQASLPEYGPRADFVSNSYIVPPAQLKSFWLATIGKSVSSTRCTSCHAMDTQAKIHDHHNGIEGTVYLVPSALHPTQQIHSCQNCHACGPQNCQIQNFSEGRWATPTQAQNINWAQIINDNPNNWPAVICQRMKTNLPTAHLREEHFHGDFRLFWAVASAYVIGPGGGQLETAPPHNYTTFISNFDKWNEQGARCPPG